MIENRKEKARGLNRVKTSRDSIKLEEREGMQSHQIQISNRKWTSLKQDVLSNSVETESDHSLVSLTKDIQSVTTAQEFSLPTVWTWYLSNIDTTVDISSREIGKIYNIWSVAGTEYSNLIAPSLLQVPKGPKVIWCYAKNKFMFQLSVGTAAVIIE